MSGTDERPPLHWPQAPEWTEALAGDGEPENPLGWPTAPEWAAEPDDELEVVGASARGVATATAPRARRRRTRPIAMGSVAGLAIAASAVFALRPSVPAESLMGETPVLTAPSAGSVDVSGVTPPVARAAAAAQRALLGVAGLAAEPEPGTAAATSVRTSSGWRPTQPAVRVVDPPASTPTTSGTGGTPTTKPVRRTPVKRPVGRTPAEPPLKLTTPPPPPPSSTGTLTPLAPAPAPPAPAPPPPPAPVTTPAPDTNAAAMFPFNFVSAFIPMGLPFVSEFFSGTRTTP